MFSKIQKWYNSARKYGYTCIALVQNYADLPIQMRRNTNYYMIFRLNDMNFSLLIIEWIN